MGSNVEVGSKLQTDDIDVPKFRGNGLEVTGFGLMKSYEQELEDTERSLLVLQLENGDLLQAVHNKQKEVETCRENADTREAEHGKEMISLKNEIKSLKRRLEDRSMAEIVGERIQKYLKLSRPPRLIFCNSILRGTRDKELKILRRHRSRKIWNLSKYRARMMCLDSRYRNAILKKKQLEKEAKNFRKSIARLSRIERLYKTQKADISRISKILQDLEFQNTNLKKNNDLKKNQMDELRSTLENEQERRQRAEAQYRVLEVHLCKIQGQVACDRINLQEIKLFFRSSIQMNRSRRNMLENKDFVGHQNVWSASLDSTKQLSSELENIECGMKAFKDCNKFHEKDILRLKNLKSRIEKSSDRRIAVKDLKWEDRDAILSFLVQQINK
eukprot:jgi/Picsp_1/5058/NSC_02421-R1_---NA---